MNRDTRNPRVPVAQQGRHTSLGVRVHHCLPLTDCHVNSCLQKMAPLEEGNHWQMWEFIRLE